MADVLVMTATIATLVMLVAVVVVVVVVVGGVPDADVFAVGVGVRVVVVVVAVMPGHQRRRALRHTHGWMGTGHLLLHETLSGTTSSKPLQTQAGVGAVLRAHHHQQQHQPGQPRHQHHQQWSSSFSPGRCRMTLTAL